MPIHNPEIGAIGPFFEKDDLEQEGRFQERKKAKALADIVESGRATTPEAAELYLERLNALKRKVLTFLRDVVIEKHEIGLTPVQSRDYAVAYLPDTFDKTNRKSVDNETIKGWHDEDIDMADPHIWTLLHECDSTSDETRPIEEIRIGIKASSAISIPEQMSGMAWSLQKYLSADELDLLNAEHDYERKALVKRLRKQADEYEQLGPRYDFPGWRSLSEGAK